MIDAGILYARQIPLELTVPETATVVGCGGTGFWTAVFLAMSGVKHLILIDADEVEASNRNRLPISGSNDGTHKVNALRNFIHNIRECRVEKHVLTIAQEHDCWTLRGSVFCCTDTLESQKLVLSYCRKNDLPYQRIGYDGLNLNVSEAYPIQLGSTPTPDGGYTNTPSWVVPAVLAAGLGVFSKLKSSLCFTDNVGQITALNSSYVPGYLQERYVENGKEEMKQEIEENHSDFFPDHSYCPDCTQCDNCERPNADDLADMRSSRDEWKDTAQEFEDKVDDLLEKIAGLKKELREMEDITEVRLSKI